MSSESLIEEIERHYRVHRFLDREAELLDNRDLRGWLDLLTSDIDYRVPIRTTRDRGVGLEAEFSTENFHLVENRGSLEARVDRLESTFAWSVDPPLRTRRFVSNVRVDTPEDEEIPVRSNILFCRSQGDSPDMDILAAERIDRLRETDSCLAIISRKVLLNHTILPTKNIPFFL